MAKQLTAPGCKYSIVARVDTTIYSPDQTWTLDVPAGQTDFIAETNEIIIPGDAMMCRKKHQIDEDTARVNVLGTGSGSLATFITRAIEQIVGKGNAEVAYGAGKLTVVWSPSVTAAQLTAVGNLLVRMLPKDVEAEWENGLPIDYTPLEYIESDGVAMMALPFESKNKTFVCEHTMAMPKATSGMYTYGGRKVSSGYGMTYRAANQGFMFIGNDYIGNGKFLRGEKYKMQWEVARNEEGKFIFSLAHEGKTLSQTQQSFNQYWVNVYYVFSSTEFEAKIGGATYELTINIEGESVKYVPALNPTGAPCLYCIETRTPYYNSGGDGDFIYPTETTTYSLRRVLPDWGKLTEHGLARLYHTPKDYEGELYDYAIERGYKQIVGSEQPEEGRWKPVWHDREDCIELEWVEIEPPTEEVTENV